MKLYPGDLVTYPDRWLGKWDGQSSGVRHCVSYRVPLVVPLGRVTHPRTPIALCGRGELAEGLTEGQRCAWCVHILSSHGLVGKGDRPLGRRSSRARASAPN